MEKIQQPLSPTNRLVPYFLIHKIPLAPLDILNYFFFHLFLLVEGQLLYNIVVGFVIH